METGKYKDFYWLEAVSENYYSIHNLIDADPNFFNGLFLAITSFDSGPLIPTEEEIKKGWTYKDEIAYSPCITSGFDLPYDQYDEWYLFKEKTILPSMEVFINTLGFTLGEINSNSSNEQQIHFLKDLQNKFWNQAEYINLYRFIGDADSRFIFVSKDLNDLQYIKKLLE